MEMSEIGSSGLRHSAGFLYEEFLHELRGIQGARKYREMGDNSPVIGASLLAIRMLCRQVGWWTEPGGDSAEDKELAEFVDSCRNDMSSPWPEVVGEHLTMLQYGWEWSEIVYKRREGDTEERAGRSKYKDGKIGWRKIAMRAQETLHRWDLDPNGGIRAMLQLDQSSGLGVRRIPIEKSLLFRPMAEKNNPEGRSLLRSAYFPWYFSKRIAESEGIGIERDLTGLPVFEIPADCMVPDASPAKRAVREAAHSIVRNVRRDEEEGIVLGQEYDAHGNPKYKFQLLTTGGQRQFDTSKILERYDRRIAMVLLTDIILMGHEGVGSYALSTDKKSLMSVALDGILEVVTEVYNDFAIPRLLRLNGRPTERRPMLRHGDIQPQTLAAVGDFLSKVFGAGFDWSDDAQIHDYLRRMAKFPRRRGPIKPRKAASLSPPPKGDKEKPEEERDGDQDEQKEKPEEDER